MKKKYLGALLALVALGQSCRVNNAAVRSPRPVPRVHVHTQTVVDLLTHFFDRVVVVVWVN